MPLHDPVVELGPRAAPGADDTTPNGSPVAHPELAADDRAWLARALAASTRARGRTAPNPHVGCLLVRDGVEVGRGTTSPAGGPHAEAVALQTAGADAAGATAYVTLEPCAHRGRTPPCADALHEAGVARVVVGLADPHRLAAGGAARLRAGGVPVDLLEAGVLQSAIADELGGFLTAVTAGRPRTTLKLAQTVDGALTADRRWITGPAARRAVHRWRAAADAVLVGAGTVLADDPRLDVRDVALGERDQPRPVIADRRLRTPVTARVLPRRPLLLTAADGDRAWQDRAARLEAAGAELVPVPATSGGLDLPAAFEALAVAGLVELFAEPGATLAAALLAAEVVDRLVCHVAPAGDGPLRLAVPAPADAATRRLGGAGPDAAWERTLRPLPVPALTEVA